MKYLINLSYNGSKYYGYQIQKNKDTVEGEIEKVLSKIFNTNINTIGASRTDKGVHALNQYCTFEVTKDLNSKKLLHSLNSLLSENVYVKSIRKVNDNFNEKKKKKRKEYIYKINMGEYNPIESEYVYQYCKNIDKELLDIFINQFKGEHNYRSFTSDKDNGSYIRNVIIDYKISKKVLYLRFESSGFLRYMIRNIVGLLLDINDSKKSICDIEDIFSKKDRTSLGRCASPVGLYLSKIEY